jgi:hypothetical protein
MLPCHVLCVDMRCHALHALPCAAMPHSYRESKAMNIVNAAFSKSVSCTSIDRNSTRHPMPLPLPLPLPLLLALAFALPLVAEEGTDVEPEAEADAVVAVVADAGVAAAGGVGSGGGLNRTVCQLVD